MLGPFVTGKTAAQQQPKLQAFLDDLYRDTGIDRHEVGPLALIRNHSATYIRALLERNRVGQYTRITQALCDLAHSGLNYRTCKRDDLIQLHGISLKSASFFLVYTQDAEHAVWDTHLLKWAKSHPFFPDDIPASTPPTRKYLDLENRFLEYCQQEDRRPHEIDWEVWSAYRRKITTPNT